MIDEEGDEGRRPDDHHLPPLSYVWTGGEWHLIMADAQDEALVGKLEAERAMTGTDGSSEVPNGSPWA